MLYSADTETKEDRIVTVSCTHSQLKKERKTWYSDGVLYSQPTKERKEDMV